MRISARNVLEGTVKVVKRGATTSHVLIDVRGLTVISSITNEAIDELGLKTGTKVKAIIIPSDVMVAVE
jgi:molybdopterin-binding protein